MGTTPRKTPRSLPRRKFWLDDQDRERVLRHVRSKFLGTMHRIHFPQRDSPDWMASMAKWVPFNESPYRNRKDINEDIEYIDRLVEEESPIQFSLGPQYPTLAKKRTKKLVRIGDKVSLQESGEPKWTEGPTRVEISPRDVPQDRKAAKQFLDKAERDLARLGFDARYIKSYVGNAKIAFDRFFMERTDRTEGELLDEFVRILEGIRGNLLWSILVTDPKTGDEEATARAKIEARIESSETTREALILSHNARTRIVAAFLGKRVFERMRSRRRRKN